LHLSPPAAQLPIDFLAPLLMFGGAFRASVRVEGEKASVQKNRFTHRKVILAVVLAAAAALMYVSVFVVMTN
jgi:hypothetical protein